eukprot:CAMPEP_0114364052 /NCGR_PEP_ID=MMETSP0101-20121206/27173_1 /TAXON_ID=38822 ORGANISM="Pteridomonas danica, Strain PT" /NCGR_SAMPLE_ID=MMETSP0101 /ASSEMBLY_ACC=CAM_ASM_000211 /LENGTH=206 /DNA_ID=CAMNT_0001511293 /DNA_START=71 /DNA_END=691 /DNA_ORIENTATION=+
MADVVDSSINEIIRSLASEVERLCGRVENLEADNRLLRFELLQQSQYIDSKKSKEMEMRDAAFSHEMNQMHEPTILFESSERSIADRLSYLEQRPAPVQGHQISRNDIIMHLHSVSVWSVCLQQRRQGIDHPSLDQEPIPHWAMIFTCLNMGNKNNSPIQKDKNKIQSSFLVGDPRQLVLLVSEPRDMASKPSDLAPHTENTKDNP